MFWTASKGQRSYYKFEHPANEIENAHTQDAIPSHNEYNSNKIQQVNF